MEIDDPPKSLGYVAGVGEVYESQDRPLAVGDLVRRNEVLTVVALLGKGRIQLQKPNGGREFSRVALVERVGKAPK